jgi:hypothetical protein
VNSLNRKPFEPIPSWIAGKIHMTVAELERHIKLERRLSSELEQYAGQWVAVRDHTVIAHAESAKQLDDELRGEDPPYRTFRVARGAGATLL